MRVFALRSKTSTVACTWIVETDGTYHHKGRIIHCQTYNIQSQKLAETREIVVLMACHPWFSSPTEMKLPASSVMRTSMGCWQSCERNRWGSLNEFTSHCIMNFVYKTRGFSMKALPQLSIRRYRSKLNLAKSGTRYEHVTKPRREVRREQGVASRVKSLWLQNSERKERKKENLGVDVVRFWVRTQGRKTQSFSHSSDGGLQITVCQCARMVLVETRKLLVHKFGPGLVILHERLQGLPIHYCRHLRRKSPRPLPGSAAKLCCQRNSIEQVKKLKKITLNLQTWARMACLPSKRPTSQTVIHSNQHKQKVSESQKAQESWSNLEYIVGKMMNRRRRGQKAKLQNGPKSL